MGSVRHSDTPSDLYHFDLLEQKAGGERQPEPGDIGMWRDPEFPTKPPAQRRVTGAVIAREFGVIPETTGIRFEALGDLPHERVLARLHEFLTADTVEQLGFANELAPHRIRVNCLAPAWTETDMANDQLDKLGREKIAGNFPLGRIGLPEDAAVPTCFLLSAAAAFMAGSTLTVDGGMAMQG